MNNRNTVARNTLGVPRMLFRLEGRASLRLAVMQAGYAYSRLDGDSVCFFKNFALANVFSAHGGCTGR